MGISKKRTHDSEQKCAYVDKNVVASGVCIVTVTFTSVRDCAHHQSWLLSVGRCGCAAAVWCGGSLCRGPPVPRPRPAHTLASATVKSHVQQPWLEGEKKVTLTRDAEAVSINATQY